jgi:hypothetical protein
MTSGPFPVAPVIERLQADAPMLKIVSQAADLRTALEQQPPATPAAYVVRQERPRRSAGASGGQLIQEIDVTIAVVLFCRNHATAASGAAAAQEMDALIAQVRRALLNWSPGQPFDPFAHGGSEDNNYRAAQLSCNEFYTSRFRIQVNPND